MPLMLLAGIGIWFENLITPSGNTSFRQKRKEWVDTLTQEQLWKNLTDQILKGGYDPQCINLICIGPDELGTFSRIYQVRCLEKPAKGGSAFKLDFFLGL